MNTKKYNRTVKRALDILQLLRDSKKPLTCQDISEAMNIPKTSAFDIIHTLLELDYVEYSSPETKSYILGVKCFEIGSGYKQDLIQIARPYAEQLMNQSNNTCFIAGIYDNQIIYLDKIESTASVVTSAVLGSRLDMHTTGLGKSILACYSNERVNKIFQQASHKKLTKNTITTIDDLYNDLNKIRKRGYAIDDREGNDNIYCIAAPIRDHTGQPIAAISVAFLYSLKTNKFVKTLSGSIVDAALNISRKMGYTGLLYPPETS